MGDGGKRERDGAAFIGQPTRARTSPVICTTNNGTLRDRMVVRFCIGRGTPCFAGNPGRLRVHCVSIAQVSSASLDGAYISASRQSLQPWLSHGLRKLSSSISRTRNKLIAISEKPVRQKITTHFGRRSSRNSLRSFRCMRRYKSRQKTRSSGLTSKCRKRRR